MQACVSQAIKTGLLGSTSVFLIIVLAITLVEVRVFKDQRADPRDCGRAGRHLGNQKKRNHRCSDTHRSAGINAEIILPTPDLSAGYFSLVISPE